MAERNHLDPRGLVVIAAPTKGLPDRASDETLLAAFAEFDGTLIEALGPDWRVRRTRQGVETVLARSDLFEVAVAEDGYGRVHLVFRPRPHLHGSEARAAEAKLEVAALGLFAALHRRWRLRMPAGPYATRPWRPPRERRAA